MFPLVEIFCFIDDFCKHFDEFLTTKSLPGRIRNRKCRLTDSEVMTIMVMFHLSHYRSFKDFYLNCLRPEYLWAFPKLVSYNRLVELQSHVFMPLAILMMGLSGQKTGRYFVDSTKLTVCHNLRMARNRVFAGIAKRSKTSTGWFFDCKLHLVINDQGQLMSFRLTPGNVDDRSPLNFKINISIRLLAYVFKPKKVNIKFSDLNRQSFNNSSFLTLN